MRIWLDDVRPIPNGFDYWAKNAYEMVGLLLSGNISHISFDHDLGLFGKETQPDKNNTGYAVAMYIEEWVGRYFHGLELTMPPRITWDIHSANPV